jgi:hypothetical protein
MYVCTYLRRYVRRRTYLPRMYITLNIMGITQGCNKIGYDFENELKNLYQTPMRECELIPEYLSKYLSVCLFVRSFVRPSLWESLWENK